MPFIMVRVDDRYIHGQVATQWMRAIPARTVYVVNDGVVKDDMTRMVLEMAASTQSITLHVLGVEEGVKQLIEVSQDGEKMWALFGNPKDVVAALNAGFKFERLIVGFMRHSPGKDGLVKGGQVYVDAADSAALRAIHEKGVEVVMQRVPDERPVDVIKLLK
jgi:mannose/fructose/N-acetylgalactosamine-specific phosphotransferase system component IIB